IQSEKRSDVEKYLVDNNICRSVKLTDDMSIESMNAIKDTLNNLVNGEGLPPLESVRYAPAQCKMMGSVASYDWTKKEMLLSDQILDYDNYLLARKNSELNWKSFRESKNIDTISKQQMEEHLKEMNSAKDIGHKKLAKVDYDMALINSNTTRKAAIETVEDVITHEFGHHIHNIVTEQSKVMTSKGFKKTIFGKNVLKIDKNNSWSINNLSGKVLASKVSGYATDSPLECFAESFLAYKKGINIPTELKEMIEEALKIIE
ncbi:MAG: hypothetical protein MR639_08825, partial [Clostridium sp.]|nr:hypothetical protein [Clostridium sp.]